MRTFTVIWFGQLVSLLGSAMTRFALLIWAYQQTGSATTLALLGFFSFGPYILVSPLAGVLIDRMERRQVMLFTNLGAGLMTVALLSLYIQGHLQIWHLYLAQALKGTFQAFELPAYSAATTMLVTKAQYSRISGMRTLAESASQVFGPIIAGLMLTLVKINGVMCIDAITFLVAVTTLLMVRIPHPVRLPDDMIRTYLWQELSFGFHYIFQRRGLLLLLMIYLGINLFAAMTYFAILPAMILARSGGQQLALASVESALGCGGIVGSLLVSVWGGPKRQVHGILAGAALSFLFGDFLFAIGRSVQIWMIAAFLGAFFVPFIFSANLALWQSKVAPQIQGKVFSVQTMLQQSTTPIGYLLAGPLADQVFEPEMDKGGRLAVLFSWLVGTGPGAGMALMFVCTSFLGVAMSLSGYMLRTVRHVEDDLPDHDETPVTAAR